MRKKLSIILLKRLALAVIILYASYDQWASYRMISLVGGGLLMLWNLGLLYYDVKER